MARASHEEGHTCDSGRFVKNLCHVRDFLFPWRFGYGMAAFSLGRVRCDNLHFSDFVLRHQIFTTRSRTNGDLLVVTHQSDLSHFCNHQRPHLFGEFLLRARQNRISLHGAGYCRQPSHDQPVYRQTVDERTNVVHSFCASDLCYSTAFDENPASLIHVAGRIFDFWICLRCRLCFAVHAFRSRPYYLPKLVADISFAGSAVRVHPRSSAERGRRRCAGCYLHRLLCFGCPIGDPVSTSCTYGTPAEQRTRGISGLGCRCRWRPAVHQK